jgi:lipoyl-dependent peroxiredoxin
MALAKTVYTARATTSGGRDNGTSKSSDGQLSVVLNKPTEMGGNGQGTNPEQLFAAGYSACFMGAMQFVAGTMKLPFPADASITADIGFGPLAGGVPGFGISAAMAITLPGMDREQAQKLIDAAHKVCPYSNATRGNIDVTLTLV